MSSLEKLLGYLATLPPGPVAEIPDLAAHLADCWDQFAGSRATDLGAVELAERIRAAAWRPPVLSLELPQDSAAAPGPSRGETRRWDLDVEKRTVTPARSASRPVPPPGPKSNMADLAEQICRLITERRSDNRLRWYSDGSVRVAVGTMLPEGTGFKQTVSNRRRKFRLALDEKLTAAGWRRVKDYVYAPPST